MDVCGNSWRTQDEAQGGAEGFAGDQANIRALKIRRGCFEVYIYIYIYMFVFFFSFFLGVPYCHYSIFLCDL